MPWMSGRRHPERARICHRVVTDPSGNVQMSVLPEHDRTADQRLLDAIQTFVSGRSDDAVNRFQPGIRDWGDTWCGVAPYHLGAADTLSDCLALTAPQTHALVAGFDRDKASRKWEQSYTKADGVVGEDMLNGYGFAEVIGKHGPFVSTRVRAGIGVWGPDIVYPAHRHAAEEVYVVLAGRAIFRLGEAEAATDAERLPGDAVHVRSMMTHGFRTTDEPLVVFYIWQAGDLREKSSFS